MFHSSGTVQSKARPFPTEPREESVRGFARGLRRASFAPRPPSGSGRWDKARRQKRTSPRRGDPLACSHRSSAFSHGDLRAAHASNSVNRWATSISADPKRMPRPDSNASSNSMCFSESQPGVAPRPALLKSACAGNSSSLRTIGAGVESPFEKATSDGRGPGDAAGVADAPVRRESPLWSQAGRVCSPREEPAPVRLCVRATPQAGCPAQIPPLERHFARACCVPSR